MRKIGIIGIMLILIFSMAGCSNTNTADVTCKSYHCFRLVSYNTPTGFYVAKEKAITEQGLDVEITTSEGGAANLCCWTRRFWSKLPEEVTVARSQIFPL